MNARRVRLSPQQSRSLALAATDARFARVRCVVEVDGALDEAWLRAAVGRAVAASEIFRTSIAYDPDVGASVQLVHPEASPSLVRSPWDGPASAAPETVADGAPRSALDVEVRSRPDGARHTITLSAPVLFADRATLLSLARTLGAADVDAPSYAQVSAWLHDLVARPDAAEGVRHWTEVMRQLASAIDAPPIRSARRTVASFDARSAIVPALGAELIALARRWEVTPDAVMATLWLTLLARLRGADSAATSLALDGRIEPEIAAVAGPLARAIPLLARIDERITVAQLARRVAEHVDEAIDWQECFQWHRVNDALATPLDLTSVPFALSVTALPPPWRAGGASWSVRDIEGGLEPCELGLDVVIQGDDLHLRAHFDGGVYRGPEVQSVLDALLAGLRDVIVRSDVTSGDITFGERGGEPRERPDAVPEEAPSLIDEIDARALEAPGALAVRCGQEHVTYRALVLRSRAIARSLTAAGVMPGELVGVCLPPGAALLAVLLAVHRVGAGYVPLDAAIPAPRLQTMIQAAAPRFIVADDARASLVEAERLLVVDRLVEGGRATPLRRARPGGPMYAILTSGSTGAPKAAQVTRRAFARLVAWYRGELALQPRDRTLIVSSVGFDLTQKNLFATLAAGASLELYDGQPFDPSGVAALMASRDVTLVNCASSTFYAIAEVAAEAQETPLGALRAAVLGGEPVDAERLRRARCGAAIYNGYGPTECTDIAAVHCIEDLASWTEATVPIGVPIPGVEMYLLDARGRHALPGALAELHIGGTGVGLGYVADPARTARTFLPDPFSRVPGARAYLTGDHAWRDGAGRFVFAGRRDDQTKIGGVRVELGEIDAAISAHGDLVAGACKVWTSSGGPVLVGYYVEAHGAHVDADQLRDFLALRLLAPVVPGTWIRLSEMPLGVNGKLDRGALPSPWGADDAEEKIAARDPVEAVLVAIWKELLGLADVGVDDDFFLVGGHSLVATRIVARVNEIFGVRLPLRALFEARSIAKVVVKIRALSAAPAELDEIAAVYAEVGNMSDDEVVERLETLRVAGSER